MNAYANRAGDEFVLGNGLIERRYRWNGGDLVSLLMTDKVAGKSWSSDGALPDCHFPGQNGTPEGATIEVEEFPGDKIQPAHLRATVVCRIGGLEVRRRFRIYPDAPAIACDYALRGAANGSWGAPAFTDRIEEFIAQHEKAQEEFFPSPILDRIFTRRRHLKLECVNFYDVTDWRNNLVSSQSVVPYLHVSGLRGNLLLAADLFDESTLFILKEAPCPDAQIAYPGCDFLCSTRQIMVTGIGLHSRDVEPGRWRQGYSVVLGLAAGGAESALLALREYQRRQRIHAGRRDNNIMLNTWGDRGGLGRITEEFCLAELEKGARLGVTSFQIDGGWQTGFAPGVPSVIQNDDAWSVPDYWRPHPQRLPRGLEPMARRSRELGIELCLWFNPCRLRDYATWRKDAEVLIRMHRRHGIRTFKIDGVDIPNRLAEENLRAMLDAVMAAAGGEAVFNLDVTAGRRFGYHYFTEYGNKFLENRYTDWKNWYPHWTLRNLWQLSRYVPPQSLQVEFLNKWRNPENYPQDDPLAPHRVPFDYCFAIAMAAQPLAWFEASGLPAEAFSLAAPMRTYVEHMERLHAGRIFPIGAEPSGAGWTGFQSCDGPRGYLLVFRELNRCDRAGMKLWGTTGGRLKCRHVLGHGKDFEPRIGEDGRVEFELPAPFTYALYEYEATR